MKSLAIDDVEVGQFVTIGETKFISQETQGEYGRQKFIVHNSAGVGNIFQVLAIDIPFVVLDICSPVSGNTFLIPLSSRCCVDLRATKLMLVSQEYKNALVPQKPQHNPPTVGNIITTDIDFKKE